MVAYIPFFINKPLFMGLGISFGFCVFIWQERSEREAQATRSKVSF
jgi:hypothetical protein